jgi:hypothetical protein
LQTQHKNGNGVGDRSDSNGRSEGGDEHVAKPPSASPAYMQAVCTVVLEAEGGHLGRDRGLWRNAQAALVEFLDTAYDRVCQHANGMCASGSCRFGQRTFGCCAHLIIDVCCKLPQSIQGLGLTTAAFLLGCSTLAHDCVPGLLVSQAACTAMLRRQPCHIGLSISSYSNQPVPITKAVSFLSLLQSHLPTDSLSVLSHCRSDTGGHRSPMTCTTWS